jgi:hypothetical protein
MQVKRYLELTGLMVLAILATAMLVSATPINYYVTSNYHGINAPLGAPVTVTATTIDTSVYQVTFLWKDATGTLKFTDVVTVSGGEAQSIKTPGSLGDWGVQALFQGPDGKTKEGITEVVAIKATSFFEAPEYAFGGLLALGACFAGLLVFKKRSSFSHIKI